MERTSGSRFLRTGNKSRHPGRGKIKKFAELGFSAVQFHDDDAVHLNDQNGIRYDQDKFFGVENLRAAFNQVKVLKENGYGSHGEYIGLDVKAMRTTKDEDSYKHLENRDFEALEMYVMNLLMGIE